MSNVNIEIIDLPDAIREALEEYNLGVIEAINESVDKHGKEMRDVAKDHAPVKTGKYKRSLSIKFQKDMLGNAYATLYAKAPHYRLVHLLEKGFEHPTGEDYPGKKHMSVGLEQVKPKFTKDIIEAVESGGKR